MTVENPHIADSDETLQQRRAVADVIGAPLVALGIIEIVSEVADRLGPEHNPLAWDGVTLGGLALATGALFISVATDQIAELNRRAG